MFHTDFTCIYLFERYFIMFIAPDNILFLHKNIYVVGTLNPCPAEPGYTLPLQTV